MNAPVFSVRTVAALIAGGLIGFAAFLFLLAFAPEMDDRKNDGGAHAQSDAATGFSGLRRLIDARGGRTAIGRDVESDRRAPLLVVTPVPGTDPMELSKLISQRGTAPTIIVLPKWATTPMPGHEGWVTVLGAMDLKGELLRNIVDAKLATVKGPSRYLLDADGGPGIPGPARQMTTIAAEGLEPLLGDSDGNIVAGRVPHRRIVIVADPDLLNNLGMHDRVAARRAVDFVLAQSPSRSVTFDVTLNGYARSPSLLKMAFQPPFLGLTLCLLAAAILAGLHAAVRFGALLPTPRAIAFGKRALVDNSAALIRRAGRERQSVARYAAQVREAALARAPAGLAASAENDWLERRRTRLRFSTLYAAARNPGDRADALSIARALYDWQKEVADGR